MIRLIVRNARTTIWPDGKQCPRFAMMGVLGLLLLAGGVTELAGAPAGRQGFAVPRFEDGERAARVRALLPEVDRKFREYAAKKQYPGMAWGIVLDGELIHTGTLGLAQIEGRVPVTLDTRFRIASMTKSFTALAILKLRDAGRLRLDDPVARYVPSLRRTPPLTRDAPAITIRHLLTMTPGFPEDNPWGDRQLADSDAELEQLLEAGLALSNPPGIAYEYSNLAYALLGRVVAKASGMSYQRYIAREILAPLGMMRTVWEFDAVPRDRLALGYRTAGAGWELEPMLHDGSWGSMGGLLTTIEDFARYVGFHQSAWPPRDEAESGPVRRASVREMHRPSVIAGLNPQAKTPAGESRPTVGGYGYGLAWQLDGAGTVRVSHSGGLPGFGSNYAFYPDHGLAVISFANLTYAGTGAVNAEVAWMLLEQAKLPARRLPVSAWLQARREQVARLVRTWDQDLVEGILAENVLLDRPLAGWRRLTGEALTQAGEVRSVGELVPLNQLRGTFSLVCERGRVEVFFTLTPEPEPKVQALEVKFVAGE